MNVVINGVEYVPKVDQKPISDEKIKECLKALTEMRYHDEAHKMSKLAWNAINALNPDLARLSEKEAYDFVHLRCLYEFKVNFEMPPNSL